MENAFMYQKIEIDRYRRPVRSDSDCFYLYEAWRRERHLRSDSLFINEPIPHLLPIFQHELEPLLNRLVAHRLDDPNPTVIALNVWPTCLRTPLQPTTHYVVHVEPFKHRRFYVANRQSLQSHQEYILETEMSVW